ncbi:M28 family peptidase [Pedobacter immunditicola]|uniref:M28 family peptidase n=1 Tax=Pedobacter immunditicola TaxID=3133440 RepID=UPI00309CBB97
MRIYILVPLVMLFSCRSVDSSNSSAQNAPQLLKDVKELSSDVYQGRRTGTKGSEMAKNYIKKRFKSIGLSPMTALPNYEQEFSFIDNHKKTLNGYNIVGYVPGKTDHVIVISAHYDHLGVINNEIYNGADDNASGVAGLFKIAAFYSKTKPNHTMIFVAFDAGEQGWKGSAAFVKNPPVSLSKIKMNINLDMISHNDRGQLFAAGTYKYPQLRKYMIHTVPGLRILFGHDNPQQKVDDWTYQSDQGAFDAVNIPFIYFGVEDHKDYHKATDKFENINQEFFIKAANAILEIVDNVDRERDLQSIFREKLQMKKQ